MSPDSPTQSRSRKAWRAMSAAGCVLSAGSLFLSVLLFSRIDASRAQVTYQACQEQNERGRKTIARYDQQIDVLTRSGLLKGERLERAKESRRFTVSLINALAPQQDCRALVRRRLGAGALDDLK